MAISSRFLVVITLQLCIPLLLYLLVGLYNRRFGLAYLLPNYLFMAAPHLLVSLLAIWPKARRPALLWLLSLLNALLVAFQLWVLLAASPHDGLAWLLYIPLWGLTLSGFATTWVVVRYSGPMSKCGAG